MKGNKMRFNISMQSDKMGEGHRDKDFSETILLAINGMASGCDIKITKVKESVEEKSEIEEILSKIQKNARVIR